MKSMKEILEIAGEGYEDLEVEDRWAESKAIMAKLYNVPIEHFNKGREKAKAKANKEIHVQLDLFDDA
tara:strand:- start:1336 stop:1539 length:204 start_codon:yes stop_codon:yes gene_type:complete